jgi:hypothetical protein
MTTTRKKTRLASKNEATITKAKKGSAKTYKPQRISQTPATRNNRAATLTTPALGLSFFPQTPSAGLLNPLLPKTPATIQQIRMPKRGETILSVCGSPLGTFNQSRVTLNVNEGMGGEQEDLMRMFGIETSNGIVDLNNTEAVAALSEADKRAAADKLKNIEANLQSMLAKLNC